MLNSKEEWRRILKKTARIIMATAGGLVLLFLSVSVAVQLPFIQNKLIGKATETISRHLDGKVEIKRIYVVVPNRVILKDISVVCGVSSILPDSVKNAMECSDTLISCNKMTISISTGNLLIGKLKLNRLELRRGVVNILNEEPKRTNLERAFRIEKERKKSESGVDLVAALKKFRMQDFRFTFKDPYKPQIGGTTCMNWANIRLSGIYVDARDLEFKGDTLTASIRNVMAKDAGGLECRKLNGEIYVCSTGAYITDLVLWDRYSKLYADTFCLRFADPHALANFTQEVSIEARLRDALFSLRSLSKISPNIPNCDGFYTINGYASGPVEHLRGKEIVLESTDGGIRLDVDYEIDGLPDYRNAIFKIRAKDSHFNTQSISDILSSFSNEKASKAILKITPETRYTVKADFEGFLDNAEIKGALQSEHGEVMFDGKISGLLKSPAIDIKASLKGTGLDAGAFIGSKSLGRFTFNSSLHALVPRNDKSLEMEIDSLRVSSARILDYSYSNIYASGKIHDNIFDGRVICHDRNLDLLLQGVFNLSTLKGDDNALKNEHYRIFANVPYANLSKLKLFNRDSMSIASFKTMSTFDIVNGVFLGEIKIFEPKYRNEYGEYSLSDIVFTSNYEGKGYRAAVTSKILNAGYQGSVDITGFVKAIVAKSLYRDVRGMFSGMNEKSLNGMGELENYGIEGELNLTTGDTRGFFNTVLPALRIEKNSSISARIDNDGNTALNFNSRGVSYGNNVIYSPQIYLTNSSGSTTLRFKAERLASPLLQFNEIGMNLRGKENRIRCNLTFSNDSTGKNSADIRAVGIFDDNTKRLEIEKESYLMLDGNRWNLSNSTMKITGKEMDIESFSLKNRNQEFSVSGVFGRETVYGVNGDSLYINLRKFNINMFNSLMSKPLNMQGVFSGKSNFSSLSGTKKMQTDISADSVYIYGNPFGKVNIQSRYSLDEKRYDILFTNDLNGKRKIKAQGYYNPWNNKIDIDIALNNLSASYFEPFVTGIFSGMKGEIEADMKLEGSPDKLALQCNELKLKDFTAKLDYTNVIYTINGALLVNENGITSKNLRISDGSGGEGIVHGGISYRYFKDIALDTRIELKNLLGLNSTIKENQTFYGDIRANGNVEISGKMDKIKLLLDVTPSSKGTFHIPLSSSASSRKSNLLTFKENYLNMYEDESYMPTFNKAAKSSATDLYIELTAKLNTLMDMYIDMGKGSSDLLRGTGDGLVKVIAENSGETMNIYGTYTIDNGDYRFSLGNFALAKRTFKINSGGTINFNGPLDNTRLNLAATYATKASISTLISDTTSVSTRRAVNCGIRINGGLSNPQIGVSIDIPDLDPTTKVRVESALNTEGKKQKQFAALLLSGGFVPDENSGITNNSTILYSNASDILSNQLNGILQELGIPLDLGLNYQPTERGQSVFDVAVSTTLFNNRIIINGNIGNDPHTTGKDVIGNVDVEIKLDEKGKLRLTLFSHSADKYSNYLDNKQRTGLGISYQREFNNRKDFLPKKTRKKKNK